MTNHKSLGSFYALLVIANIAITIYLLTVIQLYISVSACKAGLQNAYNMAITLHPVHFIFFVMIIWLWTTLGNLYLPIQSGAMDMAYPRVNVIGVLVFSYACIYIVLGVSSETLYGFGWTLYPPLSTLVAGCINCLGLFLVALIINGIGSVMTC